MAPHRWLRTTLKAMFDAPAMPAPRCRSVGLAIGGFGFSVISLGIFATVAFAERWMYRNLGVPGAYLTWTILFMLFGGLVFSLLVVDTRKKFRSYALFGAAFLSYAVGWVAAYFILRGAIGEWVGSLAGSCLMALVIAAGFGALRSAATLSGLLFAANSAGYFLVSKINDLFGGPMGMLLWGVLYGLFLGAGLGAALYVAQSKRGRRAVLGTGTRDAG